METPMLGRPVAALVGLLSGAVALGAGHLVAGAVGPGASPYLAVGNTAIDLAPPAVKEFAIRTFGTADKPVLLAGMAVVIGGLLALAGLLSRRTPTPGLVLIGALGVVGTLAVFARPDVGRLGPLAGVAALVAGLLAFQRLHRLALDGADLAERRTRTHGTPDPRTGADLAERRTRTYGTPDTGSPNDGHAGSRRGFLAAAGAAAAAAAVGQVLAGRVDVQGSRRAVGPVTAAEPAPAIPAGADFAADGTPSFITSNADFYRIDTALVVPRLSAQDWSLRIHGMVDRELRLDFDDLRRRELVERTITLTCVSNEVGGPYVSTANFVGVPLRELLAEAGVHAGADQLASRSSDGWTCGTPTEVVTEPDRDALLAIGMNGEPLPAEHGFPVRMVVPGLYGYVSATKWLVDLELTTFDAFDAYWLRRGWAQRAPIKTMSRIDRPAPFQKLPAGTVVVAGVAWAQHTGIDAVEVRVDDGPWRTATLAAEVNLDTWRMWRVELDLAPGTHTVQARATDRSGRTQTQRRAQPVPDGATGWHTVSFTTT